MKRVPDLKARPETARNFDDADWTKVDVTAEEGPLNPHEYAVFRTHLGITPEQLAASGAVLTFGMIDDHGWVYVNGQLAGVSHDWSSPALIDIGKFLHAGDNTVAVVVQNDDAAGGLNKGITLDIQDNKSTSGDWKRSAFNGLAQIIIRSSKDAGEIHLTARSDGLTETTAVIHAHPATPRPVVP
jgi:beta-galactosidase